MKRSESRIAGARRPTWYSQSLKWPDQAASPRPSKEDLRARRAARWPLPPQWLVRFLLPGRSLAVDVELFVDDGRPVVTGVAVRTTVPTHPDGSPDDPWREDAKFSALSLRARDLQRLPLAAFARAARAIVADPFGEEGLTRAVRALRGKPPRDRGPDFYEALLELNKTRSAADIARERGWNPSTVRVWLHRAQKRRRAREEQGGRT